MLIAHLSDSHLRPRGVLYAGLVDSNAMFEAAVAVVNALEPQPDLVVFTGDLVDEGTAEEYADARRLLDGLDAPVLVMPGNHDEREAFRHAFRDHAYLPAEGPLHFAVDGAVRIVGLDVTVPGDHHGLVDEAAADWLDRTLEQAPERPTVLLMHQPPIECGVPYLDPYRCFGAERLAEIVSRHAQVERVLCGHVHRFMAVRFGGTLLCTAPSTTTAIALRFEPEAEPASHVEPPAFLLHHWSRAGVMTTHHMPIGLFRGPLPFA